MGSSLVRQTFSDPWGPSLVLGEVLGKVLGWGGAGKLREAEVTVPPHSAGSKGRLLTLPLSPQKLRGLHPLEPQFPPSA